MTIDGEEENEQTETTETVAENGSDEEVLELTEEVEEESEAEPEKPKGKSVQERIDEITAARREAERDAEYWRAKALEQPQKPTEPTVDAEPDPNAYEFGEADPSYLKDSVRYEMRQELAKERQAMQIQNSLRELEHGYTQRVAEVKAEIPDYDDVVTKTAARGEWPCPPVVALAAKESEVGPKVLHHLATNLSEAVAISQLSPIEQAMAFGRLEARFSGQTVTTKIATNAPEPAPARTKGGQFAPSGTLDDRLSADDWMKRRNAQLQAK